MTRWRGIIHAYKQYLPVTDSTPIATLCEGNTPLVKSVSLGPKYSIELFFKYEGLNPTGSFKDRGMTLAISKAVEAGATAVICASTGNTSASAAAYAAATGLKSLVIIPRGKIAAGKLAQAIVHRAHVFAIDGNFDQALEIVRYLTEKYPIKLVNSINPDRLEGQKTAAFEVCDQLGDSPDYLLIPVGNAGNITAYWIGFKEYYEHKLSTKLPRMCGFQAAGAAPIVRGAPVENPETVASAIRIGNPVRWKQAEDAVASSSGEIDMVTDDEIIAAYQMMAAEEGIFAEPASAASVAGLMKMMERGSIASGSRVVCVLTGHGLKDPDAVERIENKVTHLDASVDAVESAALAVGIGG